ncbi:MAG: decaprenyl-phosphate phosphoribosyltransferase [Cyanobacteria bacterium SID2]|nr:decaprenyl-phosphate phosphoribosyltransferase [Cyanobacteria bacterium SID2]MBP0005902.1 decaprenyl-phosphate phosphoribosyltransferase [Cyanobacteria bacterium SBC]
MQKNVNLFDRFPWSIRLKIEKLPYLAALRPHQWTKNLVVFAAPLFAFNITWQSALSGLLAFALFCATSSSFYLLNDIVDVESDRQHPVKCKRPIAAGLVSIPAALTMALVLLSSALLIGWLHTPALGLILLGYAILQVAYNLKLKHAPIADVIAIATGFILRACAGGAATQTPVSSWFLLCTAMLALFLGIEKRKAELRLLQRIGKRPRRYVLRRYSLPLLLRMESVVTTGTVISYALWSSGPLVGGAPTAWMLVTVPFVLYGIFRYQLISDFRATARQTQGEEQPQERSERPEEVLLSDRPILLCVIGWLVTVFVIELLHYIGWLN